MDADLRRVRHLRLRADSAESARRAETLLSDALHTASLPQSDSGRLLLIRRLSLGIINPRASPASIALLVEKAAKAAEGNAVEAESRRASEADVVAFRSRGEALLAAARRVAARLPTHEWFWTAAFPGWVHQAPTARAWFSILELAQPLPESTLIAAQIVAIAAETGNLRELASALPRGIGQRWLAKAGWVPEPRATTHAQPEDESSWTHHESALRTINHGYDEGDDRSLWLATMLAVAHRPARAADPELPSRASRILHQVRSYDSEAESPRHPANDEGSTRPNRPRIDRVQEHPTQRGRASPASSAQPRESPGKPGTDGIGVPQSAAWPEREESENVSAPSPRRADPSRRRRHSRAPLAERQSTVLGGLLFLVPLLSRLGFRQFLNGQPALLEQEFPARLLAGIGHRINRGADDPLLECLEAGRNPEALRMLESHWLRLLRATSRRELGLGLWNLVHRPARFEASRTHLDLFFSIKAVDLRVRRAALDLNPGWVPWLGKVLGFHYLDAHDL